VHLGKMQLSDLFFALPKANYEAQCGSLGTDADMDAAILEDAIEFAVMVGQAGNDELIDWAVADFKRRL
jgi:hypothetical protein